MKGGNYPGLNVQYPISQCILDGSKTVETRTYPLPREYLKKEMLLIETPGPARNFKARIVAIIVIDDCFLYTSEASFYEDIKRHRVNRRSPWRWNSDKPKWGWRIATVIKLKAPHPAPAKRGIKFSKNIELSI